MAVFATGVLERVSRGEIEVAAIVTVTTFVVSTAVMIGVIVWLPADYFALEGRTKAERLRWAAELPYRIGKNLLGFLLVVVGLIMAVPGVPGQGVLTMFAGLLLLEFPGQRTLVKKVLARHAVLHAVNKIRGKFGREPMVVA